MDAEHQKNIIKPSALVKVLTSRSGFTQFLMEEGVGDSIKNMIDVMSLSRDSCHYGEYLSELLIDYVEQQFKCLDVKIYVDWEDFRILFPEGCDNRVFIIKLIFEDQHTVNKMKLKYPEIMSKLGIITIK